MTRELFRIREPEVFNDPEVVDLFERAFVSEMPSNARSVLTDLQSNIGDYVLVGVAREKATNPLARYRNDRLVGLVIAFLPTDNLFKVPTIYHFYSTGSNEMRNMMIDAVVDWVKENGYNKFLASNFTKRPDCLWKRLFRRAGKLEKVGSIYMFELKEE